MAYFNYLQHLDIFLKYELCLCSCTLQFHGHHSYIRKDFQMLLAVKEEEISPPHRVLAQI